MVKQAFNTVLSISSAFCIALSLASCTEKGVNIKMDRDPVASDTTFIAKVEAQQPRMVLIEEFTGVSCPPCPLGHQALAALIAQYPGRVAAMGIQVFGFTQANPIMKGADSITKHDNRTAGGTELATDIYGKLSQAPMAGIDRIVKDPRNNSLYNDRSGWSTAVGQRLSVPAIANISITSKYIDSTQKAIITVHVAYTAALSKKQKMTVAIIENKVIDAQESGLDIIKEYEHEHVLRDLLTSSTGSAIMSGVPAIEAGRVYERTFIYDMSTKSHWDPKNCKIIAFVSNNEPSDLEVQQSAEASLK